MSNKPEFFLTPIDREVMKISPEERLQIILDYSELEQTGKTGDSALRNHAGRIYRTLQQRESGFDAAYMMFTALACHKVNSIAALNKAYEIEDTPAPLTLDDREIAAVLAGLRLVQGELGRGEFLPLGTHEIFDDGGTLEPLSRDEIDDLCEKMNVAYVHAPKDEDDAPCP